MKGAVHEAENPDNTFDDVVGVDEAKAELQEIVMYLKEPQRFTRLGGRLGTGDTCSLYDLSDSIDLTTLSIISATLLQVKLFWPRLLPGRREMFVGVGARRMRDLFFEAAKAKAACIIIFIDEVDSQP